MKVITINTVKGGVGKTTFTYQFGEFLASLGNKILLIDFDFQRNLTELYLTKEDASTEKGSVKNILLRNYYKEGANNDGYPVKINHVKENIDLVAGSATFEDVKVKLAEDTTKNWRLSLWLEPFAQQNAYDYVLIDTRPEFDFIVGNAVLASEAVISPITPDKFGLNSRYDELALLELFREQNFDIKTRKSLVDAKLMLLANKVKHTTLSKDLITAIQKQEIEVIETIPEREIFNKSTQKRQSFAEMKKNKKYNQYKDFFKEMDRKWFNIKDKIDEL